MELISSAAGTWIDDDVAVDADTDEVWSGEVEVAGFHASPGADAVEGCVKEVNLATVEPGKDKLFIKFSQLEIVNKQCFGGGVLSFQWREFRFVLYI